MKNIRIKTISGNTFEINFILPLKTNETIPTVDDIYQVNGDLMCKIISQDSFKDYSKIRNPKLEVIFEDLYKNTYKLTIEEYYSFEKKKYGYRATISEKREWIAVGELTF
jgi:hypothetical protein